MTRFRTYASAVLAAACAALGLARVADADARPEPAPLQRDTTLVFETGDEVRLSVAVMGGTGVEMCAAIGPRVRGSGKSMQAQADAWTSGAGLPTIQRFPSSGSLPYCTRLTHRTGDSLTVAFAKQVRDPMDRVARLTVGSHRMALPELARRRVTFRWVREGVATVPSAPPPEGVEERR